MALTYRKLLMVGFTGVLMMSMIPSQAIAETCTPLNVLGGFGTSATKSVSIPATLWTRNNWNTDFSVPGGVRFNRYVVIMTAKNGAVFDMKTFLKYSDNTADNFLNQSVPFNAGQTMTFVATPRPNDNPFAVNVFVGGISAVNSVYTLTVEACK